MIKSTKWRGFVLAFRGLGKSLTIECNYTLYIDEFV
jgi:hypothetical protein